MKFKPSKNDLLIALRFALTMGLAVFISKYFRLPHAYWLPMTVAGLYLSGGREGMVVPKANKMLLGTVLGLFFAYLYVRILMYPDYRWGYAFPAVAMIALLFVKNMTVMYILLTAFMVLLLCVVVPEYENFNLIETMLARLVNVGLGGALVLVMEIALFRKAGKALPDIRENVRSILKDFQEVSSIVVDAFCRSERPAPAQLSLPASLSAKYLTLEKLFNTRRNEFGYDECYDDKIYGEGFRQMQRIYSSLNTMLWVVMHPVHGGRAVERKEPVREAGRILSEALERIREILGGRRVSRIAPVTGRLEGILDKGETGEGEKYGRDHYFITGIREISAAVDELEKIFTVSSQNGERSPGGSRYSDNLLLHYS
ncbi:MAG: FUSC family protein [Candidatus Auribacterota bacterium]|nr:FUSC family protein [Candidatus Auribacterota bacterium]